MSSAIDSHGLLARKAAALQANKGKAHFYHLLSCITTLVTYPCTNPIHLSPSPFLFKLTTISNSRPNTTVSKSCYFSSHPNQQGSEPVPDRKSGQKPNVYPARSAGVKRRLKIFLNRPHP